MSDVIPNKMKVLFSPNNRIIDFIIEQIEGATKEILVQAYLFTSLPLLNALIDRKRIVKIILDYGGSIANYSLARGIFANRLSLRIDSAHPISHNKIIIIDRRTVLTGSFNYTANAENNAENLIVIDSTKVAKAYRDNWKQHEAHSPLYSPKTPTPIAYLPNF